MAWWLPALVPTFLMAATLGLDRLETGLAGRVRDPGGDPGLRRACRGCGAQNSRFQPPERVNRV